MAHSFNTDVLLHIDHITIHQFFVKQLVGLSFSCSLVVVKVLVQMYVY